MRWSVDWLTKQTRALWCSCVVLTRTSQTDLCGLCGVAEAEGSRIILIFSPGVQLYVYITHQLLSRVTAAIGDKHCVGELRYGCVMTILLYGVALNRGARESFAMRKCALNSYSNKIARGVAV